MFVAEGALLTSPLEITVRSLSDTAMSLRVRTMSLMSVARHTWRENHASRRETDDTRSEVDDT